VPKKLDMLGALSAAVPDRASYTPLMEQIAPDHPVTAVAGVFVGKDRPITVETHLFGPNAQQSGREIAATLLEGDALINRSKAEKAQEGKPASHGLFVPPETELKTAFDRYVGKAFRGDPTGADRAFQAVRAFYTGTAARDGDVFLKDKGIDTGRLERSVRAVIGEVYDYNGRGEVLLPLGMERDTFKDRVRSRFADAVKASGLPDNLVDQLPAVGLLNRGEGRYLVISGTRPLTDRRNEPLELNVNDVPPVSSSKRRNLGAKDVPL
jgi:hypothetical protein